MRTMSPSLCKTHSHSASSNKYMSENIIHRRRRASSRKIPRPARVEIKRNKNHQEPFLPPSCRRFHLSSLARKRRNKRGGEGDKEKEKGSRKSLKWYYGYPPIHRQRQRLESYRSLAMILKYVGSRVDQHRVSLKK